MWAHKQLPGVISHPVAGEIKVKTHPRSKRLRLSFQLPFLFVLTVPPRTSEAKVRHFLDETEAWIAKQVAAAQAIKADSSHEILFQGLPYQIAQQPLGKRDLYQIDASAQIILLDLVGASVSQRIEYLCRKELRKRLPSIIEHYSQLMGLFPAKVAIRDTRSRWGSCSSAGHISLCWRLIMAPQEVLDYVVVHELAHLRHMNHSPEFWSLVADYCPTYKEHRQWLKANSRRLHAT